MKSFAAILISIIISMSCFSQVQKTPDKYVDGKKEGLWTEYEWLYTWMDSTGQFYVAYNLHFAPLPAYCEGFYSAGVRVGYWKTFQLDLVSAENGKREMRKGSLVSVLEYTDANSCSLYVEYYKNGNMKVLGQFQEIPVNRPDTVVQIPDWIADPNGNILKDTIIHTTSVTRPFGKWYYFRSDGSVKELDMAKLP
ncbi:hypothetical protein [Pinibacter soli]|uniref:WG repeat-containing protein n=1 Tax=Pinibacter soli TaxID=3044211 RepID=A0ABT6RA54_9BACT|nr:hypothetical protein [Pinibacter soli]MDI3319393.1 hypothetical protein [Pinibacter soli]